MKHDTTLLAALLLSLLPCVASAQTSRMYLQVKDASFKINGDNNVRYATTNAFKIGSSYGTVYWNLYNRDFSGYQALVVRFKKVEGNFLHISLFDYYGTEYVHNVDVANIDGEQEFIIDLMQPLKNSDGTKTLDLKRLKTLQFWNGWDDGDGVLSCTATIDEMYFEPYGGTACIGNPIVQTCYTADPAPMVSGDRLYIYTGHDEPGASGYEMNEWRVYSTADMVNWTDHGSPLRWNDFSWCKGGAWAAQAIERDGKVYWYVSCENRTLGYHVVGVAVGDSPTGPFTDQRGSSLTSQFGDIDPTVFIDNDGQAYVYYGNNALRYVLLNDDMISVKDGPHSVELTTEAFGGVKKDGVIAEGTDAFEEGPWFYRRGDLYYLVYAAGGVPEHLAYSTATSPTGPWTYRGIIMPSQGGSFTNHPGVIDFKGHTYLVYHSGMLLGGSGFQRSVCVDEFSYNDDGTIPTFNMTRTGCAPIGTLNPYERTEAETIAWSYGVKTQQESDGNVYVDSIGEGDYIKVREVDFGTEGARAFTARVKGTGGGTLSVYADNPKATALATLTVGATTGWSDLSAELASTLTGKHDLYFVFSGTGDDLMQFDCWQFTPAEADAIMTIEREAKLPTPVYTLGGMRVENPDSLPQGIYIADGKKYLNR